MKIKIGFTIEEDLLREVDELRGLVKRSTFIEHMVKLGLEYYKASRRDNPNRLKAPPKACEKP